MPSNRNGSKWRQSIQDLSVLDIHDLERRWLKYKFKSYAPHILGAVLMVSMAVGTISWFLTPPDTSKNSKPSQQALNNTLPVRQDNRTSVHEKAPVLEPSMEFMLSLRSTQMEREAPAEPVAKTTPSFSSAAVSVPPPKVLTMPDTVPLEPAVHPAQTFSKAAERSLSINRAESKLDIEELKQRFKETSNANLGLFIARYYYDKGEYTEAYNYSLKTNAINAKIDESWILFSKSLVKLGKSEQAKKTLQLYVQQSNSDSARGLLESIEKGTFK